MRDAHTQGKVITFYSYKGGTGRSMALANLACLLAGQRNGRKTRVLVIDWDLEAPGLHRYFSSVSDPRNEHKPGLINYFDTLAARLSTETALYDSMSSSLGWRVLDKAVPLDGYIIRNAQPGVDCIKAGNFGTPGNREARYSELVSAFNWVDFYTNYNHAIEAFRKLLTAKYDYILIDSRTGVTDVSGICTMLLPECLVGVFTPNEQSLYGLLDVIEQALEYRRNSNDFRALSVFPLPSRIEVDEQVLRAEWRQRYQQAFERLFRKSYGVQDCNLEAYFNEVMLPHRSYFAYGERLAVLEEQPDALSLRRAYEAFFELFTILDFPWEAVAKDSKPIVTTSSSLRYDVFLSYQHGDEDAAGSLATRLQDYGIRVYYDQWHLLPGQEWQSALESALQSSGTVALLLGRRGVSEFQIDHVNQTFLTNRRVIPVLLAGVSPNQIPEQVRNIVRVDFKNGLNDPKALRQLISGITGNAVQELVTVEHDHAQEESASRTVRTGVRSAHFKAIANAIAYGQVIPVVGWGANVSGSTSRSVAGDSRPPRPSELARYLAAKFAYPDSEASDLVSVADFVSLSAGPSALNKSVRSLFAADYEPTPVHEFVAAVPSILRRKGLEASWRLIVSVTFDNLLDRAFEQAGEPYSRIIYRKGSPHREGLFVYGEENAVQQDQHPRFADDSVTILKLNGDLLNDGGLVLTIGDYIDAITDTVRTPPPLPIMEALYNGQFLFLGFGIRDWPSRIIESRIRPRRGRGRENKSWAVGVGFDTIDTYAWQQLDVEAVDMDLDSYVLALTAELEALPGGGM